LDFGVLWCDTMPLACCTRSLSRRGKIDFGQIALGIDHADNEHAPGTIS
jgi:hypothetical protein